MIKDIRAAVRRVRDAELELLAARTDLEAVVRRARATTGTTWESIGQVLGVTRQAAQQWFGG